MKRLIIAAAGLALVGGIIIGGAIGNPFGRSSASAAAVGGRLISLGTISVTYSGIAEFPMVNVSDCSRMTAIARSTGSGNQPGISVELSSTSPDGSIKIAGLPNVSVAQSTVDGFATAVGDIPERVPYLELRVRNGDPSAERDITGWIWCATSESYVVGGVAEPPDLASRTGASGMGGGTYAVLAGGLALAGLGILAVKRRAVQ